MDVRAVLFDIGGVLETTPSTGWGERWAARLGIDKSEILRRLRPTWRAGDLGLISLEEVEQRVGEELGIAEAHVREFMEDQWAEYLGTLNEPLAEYFAGLRPRYRTGILSNSFVGAREREQDAYDFASMCDVIVYSHEEGLQKPDPAFYAIGCERLEVQPGEVVFLDDLVDNVEAARALGMRAVHFGDTDQAIADIEAHLGSGRGAEVAPARGDGGESHQTRHIGCGNFEPPGSDPYERSRD